MEPGSSRSSTTVQLQVQQRDGAWNDAGSVHLLDEGNDSSNNNDNNAGSSSLRNQLPRHAKAFLRRQQQQSESTTIPRRQIYLYRHAAPNNAPNTNLCLFLHGAGDTHTKFDALAQQMALPQTACLSIQAVHHIQLPFNLGTTWFQEIDFATGDTLPIQHPKRIQSLQKAVQWLTRLLHYCCNNCGDTNGGWPAERIFLLGYGAGACLVMETCAAAAASDTASTTIYGGAVCIGGGIRVAADHDSKPSGSNSNNTETKTPILLMVGERDEYFTPQNAQEAARAYGNENVQIHLERNKGQGMIQNADEMRVVMQFFADRLVRQSTMGGTAPTAFP